KALERLGELLAGSSTERHRWPWLNLYRVSDPIGSWVFGAVEACEPVADAVTPSPREVDWQFVDPRFGRPPGDLAYPPVLAHSDYWLDDDFAIALGLVEARRVAAPSRRQAAEPAVPDPRTGPPEGAVRQ